MIEISRSTVDFSDFSPFLLLVKLWRLTNNKAMAKTKTKIPRNIMLIAKNQVANTMPQALNTNPKVYKKDS